MLSNRVHVCDIIGVSERRSHLPYSLARILSVLGGLPRISFPCICTSERFAETMLNSKSFSKVHQGLTNVWILGRVRQGKFVRTCYEFTNNNNKKNKNSA